jgi:DNA-directed RNA polymerase subunit omega
MGILIMGRVTIENCLGKVDSHFDLVLVAAERAKQISSGKKSEISKKGIKTHVTALREIEKETVLVSDLKNTIIDKLQNSYQYIEEDYVSNPVKENYIFEELQSSEFVIGELEEIDADDLFDDGFQEDIQEDK